MLFDLNGFSIKSNKLLFLILIIQINIISSSIIKIPFKILKLQSPSNQRLEKTVEDMTFYFKIFSLIEIGNPPQKIEVSFSLRSSNFFISNECRNCTSFYSYENSNSFTKIETDRIPIGFGNPFYANETFYFYDNNNKQKKVENMMIYLPRLPERLSERDLNLKNCLIIGLKFPTISLNNFQESFIQQLKRKNIINQYFWTMVFYDKKNEKDYDGAFIFGDIINDYYPYINASNSFSLDNIVHTYTGNRKRKNQSNRKSNLEWGIQFDEIYYECSNRNLNTSNENDNMNNIVYMHRLITEFNLNINVIYTTFEYSRNIQRDYFNFYFEKNICKYTYMRGSMYKFIYCNKNNFTQSDLEKFPVLNFKNKILRYIFTLDYKDLFTLTYDKKYYIFNIMVVNVYQGDGPDGGEWVFGLPFWRKYQFSFDIDTKSIYFYNKNGKFLEEIYKEEPFYDDIDDKNVISSKEEENSGKSKNITNDKGIITRNKKNENNYVEIKMKTIFLVIILTIVFIFLFCILLILVKKILFKKGFILMRIKKANELNDEDFDYSSKNINFIKNEGNIKSQELEMQVK